jgi:methyltransferase
MVTVTQTTFLALVGIIALVSLQRLMELRTSRRNAARLRALGAVEHAAGQVPWMQALHGAWLVAIPLEVLALDRAFEIWVAGPALAVFMMGQALRFAAMHALGARWSVRVLTLPGEPPVLHGIFRRLRHPNYLGVILELAALPLLHGAWITALVFSAANAIFLHFRIRAEEAALESAGGYREAMGDRPLFLPRMG